VRHDTFSEYENKTTGKLGLSYKFSPEISAYINAGTAYRAPSFSDIIWKVIGVDLKPETIHSYNIGINFHTLHVNAFYNKIEDKIAMDNSYKNYNSEGTSTFKGIEISLEQAIAKDWLMGASYTYTDALDGEDKRAIRVPRYQASANITYVPTKNLRLTALGNYIGPRKESKTSTVDTGRYFLAHFKADYAIDKTWNIYGKVNNLLDRDYQEVDGYATLGRTFYLGMKATF
jgi:vitamin B12 transporter